MATIKSYTDLSQSKVLAKILPIESADMYWYFAIKGNPKAMFNEGYNEYGDFELPCLSLEALLSVIPKRIKHYNVLAVDFSEDDISMWYDEIAYRVNSGLPDITKDNIVDACYEMIIKLHEQKLL